MVKRILDYIQREISGLHQAAYLLAAFALLADILGLVRDRLLAYTFGAGPTLDLYYAAFRVPDFIFATVASTVSLSVLIPLFVEKLDADKGQGKRFLDTVFTFFFIVMGAVSAGAFVAMPYISARIFPGIADQAELVMLSRVLLLSPVLLGLSNLLGSITQTFKRFFVYASSPLLYNLGTIAGIVVFYPIMGIGGVILGVVIGAALHMGIQVPFVWGSGLMPTFASPDWKEVKRVVLMSLPRTLALSITQISTLFILSLASLMTAGSISIFNLAYSLNSVPLSIIGVSYSMAAFPTLARLFSGGDKRSFMDHIVTASRHVIFWSMPVTVLFLVLRAHIVRVILGSGQFGWTQTRLTAAALGLLVISSVFQSLMLLLVRGYYSAGQTRRPLVINAVGGILVIAFSYALTAFFTAYPTFRYFVESLFRVSDIPGTEVLMLPLGFTLGSIANGALLWYFFNRDFGGYSKPLRRAFFQCTSVAVVMGFMAHVSLDLLVNVFDNRTFVGILLQGLFAGLIGIGVGILLLKAMDNAEIDEIGKALHKKFWKAKAIAPDPNVTG